MARDTVTAGDMTAARTSKMNTASAVKPVTEILSKVAPGKMHVTEQKSGRTINEQLSKKAKNSSGERRKKRTIAQGDN